MSDFKVGDYITLITTNNSINTVFRISKYDAAKDRSCIARSMTTNRKRIVEITYGNGYSKYRRATVLDYIRTLSVEQMTRILRLAEKKCRFCTERRKDTGDCKYYTHLPEECDEGIMSFLNQPLTDKIVKWLGGN